ALPTEMRRKPARSMPPVIWPMISSGSSLRGLSEVTTAKSAPSAAAEPISGRLPRSRSPPHPNTTSKRPLLNLPTPPPPRPPPPPPPAGHPVASSHPFWQAPRGSPRRERYAGRGEDVLQVVKAQQPRAHRNVPRRRLERGLDPRQVELRFGGGDLR